MAARTSAPAGPPDRIQLGAVFAGGAAGALARASLTQAWHHGAGGWPWATFLANVAGAFALGVVAAAFVHGPGPPGIPRALLGTGLCGALTTFSTLQVEAVLLVGDGHTALAAAYLTASLAAGLAAVWAGDRGARALRGEGSR